MNKKIAYGILAAGIAAATAFFGYNAPSADAKNLGDLPSCQAGCDASAGCLCNRQCFLVWCWGDWYCQCHAEAEAEAPPADSGMSEVPSTLSPETTQ